MKTTLFVFFLSFPLFLLAQDDYCTCMDEKPETAEDLTAFVAQVQEEISVMIPQMPTETDTPSEPERLIFSPEPEEIKEDVQERKAIVAERVKKRRKTRLARVPKQKKFKKYRGGCPWF